MLAEIMRSQIFTRGLGAIALLYLLGMGTEARSQDTSTARRLRETRNCAGCNLSNTNLASAYLHQANLRNGQLK
jgi:uncharacterized protein YjbI with pentapeptide repeats